MIELPRDVAHDFRTVLEKSVLIDRPRQAIVPITLQTGPAGYSLRACQPDVAIEYRTGGPLAAEKLIIPSCALAAFSGIGEPPVALVRGDQATTARWSERGLAREHEYKWPLSDPLTSWPPSPKHWASLPPTFLRALDDAMQTAAPESLRYATHRVQFRGRAGQLVATDATQLLMQARFAFPFKADLLVPRVLAFGQGVLPSDQPVFIGQSARHLTIQVGRWTFHLTIDRQARYPRAEDAISKAKPLTVLRLAPAERDFLLHALPTRAQITDEEASLTLVLDGHALIRARKNGPAPLSEVVLENAKVSGPPVSVAVGQRYLYRALKMGFGEIGVATAATPVVCRSPGRVYVFMPLSEQAALGPDPDAVKIAPPHAGAKTPLALSTRRKPAMRTNRSLPPTRPTPQAPEPSGSKPLDPVEEAEALQRLLREALARQGRLLFALKGQRKQTRLVASTLASLRQLEQVPT